MNTTDKLAAALRRYVDCDNARDNAGDTPAAQARAALAEYDASAEPTRATTGGHAPGPWRIERAKRYDGWMQTFIVAADYPHFGIVAEVNMARNPAPIGSPPDGEASARRIVACVNACTGISTAALESGIVTELLDERGEAVALDLESVTHGGDA